MIATLKDPFLALSHGQVYKPQADNSQESDSLNSVDLNQFLAGVERRAFGMAMVGTNNREDALDIVQDAMMGFVKYYAEKPTAEWRPLFYRVLNSKMMDFHRRQSVRNRWRMWLDDKSTNDGTAGPEDHHSAYADPSAASGELFVASEQRLETLQLSLQTLPPRQRQAFMLRCWEGLSTRDTAEAMECSEGSVKTHYSRALGTLKTALEGQR